MNQIFLKIAAAVALSGTLPLAQARTPGKEAPNVILISLDTAGADHMSVYGYKRETTPFLSQLAKDAATFENSLAQGAFTLPSHYSMFTGLFPQRHGVCQRQSNSILDTKHKTLTEHLKAAGYSTFFAGILNAQNLSLTRGLERGFDEKQYFEIKFDPGIEGLKNKVTALKKSGKFFLFLHTYMPHDPYMAHHENEPPSPFERSFIPKTAKSIEFIIEKLLGTSPALAPVPTSPEGFFQYWFRVRNLFSAQFDLKTQAGRDHLISTYDGGIKSTDERLAKVISMFKAAGVYENSLIIVTSDHGEAFGEHGQWYHGNPYHEVLHVPLVIKFPGGRYKGKRVRETVHGVDLAPTVLEVLGLPPAAQSDGLSLLGLFRSSGLKRNGYSYSTGPNTTAVWDRKWNLLVGPWGTTDQLYDIVSDPLERTDVIAAHPQVALKMKTALNAFRLSQSHEGSTCP
jgi:arylsulfatase A-like enzyme